MVFILIFYELVAYILLIYIILDALLSMNKAILFLIFTSHVGACLKIRNHLSNHAGTFI